MVDTAQHAMVMVGYRIDPSSGKVLLLLQNWWISRQFLEVDEDYFNYSKARLFFCRHAQKTLRSNYDVTFGEYIEAAEETDMGEACSEDEY